MSPDLSVNNSCPAHRNKPAKNYRDLTPAVFPHKHCQSDQWALHLLQSTLRISFFFLIWRYSEIL